MVIETKMAVDRSVSFLNCKTQHTNLKLRTFNVRSKQNKFSLRKIAPQKLIANDQFKSLSTATKANHKDTISAKLPTKLMIKTRRIY